MRPVNLIPPEERAGSRKPLRSGPLAYMLVGALAAAVIAITALVVTENSISDKKAEVTQLEAEAAQITAKAQALSPYTQFASVREQRLATVAELANSRFDWPRILHELSLVIPADVQLTSLAGNVSSTSGGAGVGLRSGIAGPALEMIGCASGQAGVAAFIEAVKSIDGVTRVGIQGSSISAGAGGEGNATAAGACSAGGTAQFQLVAAFDAAPVPTVETGGEVAPEAAAPEATAESTAETTSGESSESTESTSTESSATTEGAAE